MATSGVAVVMVCLALFYAEFTESRERVERELQTQANIIAANSTAALMFDDAEAGRETLSALKAAPNITSACIFTPNGRRFACYQRNDNVSLPITPKFSGIRLDGEILELVQPIEHNLIVLGLLTLRFDMVALYSDQKARAGLAAIVGSLAIALSLLLGLSLRKGLTRPLQELLNAAKQVGEDDYSVRAKQLGDDEFGTLTIAFNAMIEKIQERDNELVHQAQFDSLTGLPNYTNILQRLGKVIERARIGNTSVAVLYIRLSRMNAISSTLGHSVRDEVIILTAKHLPVDQGQILGHLGTSEFVIILPDTNADDALNYAERIVNVLTIGFTLNRANIPLQSEIGIADFPQHATNAVDLLRKASIAQSEAEARKQAIVTYENGREECHLRQQRMVNDLYGAIKREEILVYFQPKVSLPDGKPCGAEALVRWNHPEMGWLPPDDFIPAAEQAGAIVHLTRYVLARAVKQCRVWEDEGYVLQVSVNLSARDLLDEQLPENVVRVLKDNQVPADRLTLEITENAVMQEIDRAIGILKRLRSIGVRISMADFGTGYSSLAQLKNMPLNELKIDKSFVKTMLIDPQNEAIVKTALELAHNMHLDVVAEGVEDEATIRHLTAAGCEQAQGYLLSKPMTSDELLKWLSTWQPKSYTDRRTDDSRPFKTIG